MKTCFKCKQSKSRDEFYAHPAMADGLLSKCKECARSDVRANRIAKYQQYREYEKQRQQTPERKEKLVKYLRTMRAVHPEHAKARAKVNYHVRAGNLQKQPCEFCGATKVEAHHEDYSKPLEVRWLCHTHHRMVHGTTVLQANKQQSLPF